MTNSCNTRRYNCIDIAFLISIVVGIIGGVLRYTAVITVTPAFLWVLFGIAVGFLAILLVTAGRANNPLYCGFSALRILLVAILVTILLAVVLLGITFVATSVIGAIITGGLIGFFALLVTTTVCLIKQIVLCND